MLRPVEFEGTEDTPFANALFERAINATNTLDDPHGLGPWLDAQEPAALTLCELLIDGLLPDKVQALRLIVEHVALRAVQLERLHHDEVDAEEIARREADDANRRAELCEQCRQREDAKEGGVIANLAALIKASRDSAAPGHTP